MNFFTKMKQFFQVKDELVGLWETNQEDQSETIWRCILDFKTDGTGLISTWGEEEEITLKHKEIVIWERIDESTILIKLELDSGWDKINYQISPFKNAQLLSFDELHQLSEEDASKKIFWNIPLPLYRAK